ncbi:hypothetical protein CDAR_97651 [Caerostris darwini]|uniref:Gustatory receptor n=1 Tax=Caerostris darwini TaxID=1538125 RepID=A0AAV4NGA0_9ARAC|nr:hypothetical protein CDAR_97651 [Caerostris darwini]
MYMDFISYGFKFGNELLQDIYFSVKLILLVSFPFFCITTVLLFYLTASYYTSVSLQDFKNTIEKCSLEEFVKTQQELVSRYSQIIQILQNIQQLLSGVSFFLCLGLIISCFANLAYLLLTPDQIVGSTVFEHAFSMLTNSLFLMLLFYFAGQIPIKMSDIRTIFYVKHAELTSRLLTSNKSHRFRNSQETRRLARSGAFWL